MARTSKYPIIKTESPAENLYKWNAGLYIRLSREDGDKAESESISSQKALLSSFLTEHKEIALFDSYVDDGWSGTDFERPEFQRMLRDATNKRINCVIVKDLSRFGRNYVESGKYIETIFPAFKIRFIAVNDRIDSFEDPSSVNNVIVPFKNIINDEYCRDISLKVRSALDVRRRAGKFIGSFAGYGYKKDLSDRSKLIIDEEAAQTVRYIYKRYLEGSSIAGITRELNAKQILNPSGYKRSKGINCNRSSACGESGLWVDSTVRRILSNELYIGNLVQKKNEVISYKIHKSRSVEAQNRIVVENTHKAIIPVADFIKVQNLLSRDTRVSPQTGKLSVFAGFVKCADCGRAMQRRVVRQNNKVYEYYVCSTYRKISKTACTKHAIRTDYLEEAVLAFLNKYISLAVDFDRLLQTINRSRKRNGKSKRLAGELAAKELELGKTKRLLLDIYPDFKSGLLSREQYLALKEQYENSYNKTVSTIESIKEEMRTFADGVDGSNEFIATFKKFNGLQKLTREIVIELIENIYIFESGKAEIHLKCKDSLLAASEYIQLNADGIT